MATFSACFGAPFMPRHPGEYAAMLIDRLARYDVPVWLVNTGWTGGPYGTGERMNINHTRTMVRAALNGELDGVATRRDPIFGVEVPTEVPGVPSGILDPRSTWADGAAYDAQAAKLARMFADNFRSYADGVPPSVRDGGPARHRRRRPGAGAGGSRRRLSRRSGVAVGEQPDAQVALRDGAKDPDDEGEDRGDNRDRDQGDGGDRQPGDHRVARRLSIVWNRPAAKSSDAPRPMTSTRPPPKMPMKMSTTPLMIIAATDWDVSSVRFSMHGIVARTRTRS